MYRLVKSFSICLKFLRGFLLNDKGLVEVVFIGLKFRGFIGFFWWLGVDFIIGSYYGYFFRSYKSWL